MKVSQQCNHKGKAPTGRQLLGTRACSTRPTAWLLFCLLLRPRAPSPETPVAQGMGLQPGHLSCNPRRQERSWATPVYFLSSSILVNLLPQQHPFHLLPIKTQSWRSGSVAAWLAHARPRPKAHLPTSRPPGAQGPSCALAPAALLAILCCL